MRWVLLLCVLGVMIATVSHSVGAQHSDHSRATASSNKQTLAMRSESKQTAPTSKLSSSSLSSSSTSTLSSATAAQSQVSLKKKKKKTQISKIDESKQEKDVRLNKVNDVHVDRFSYHATAAVRQSNRGGISQTNLSQVVAEINAQTLTPSQRQLIVGVCADTIEGINPNSFIRNRFLNINPVSALRSFQKVANPLSPFAFHSNLRRIFASMRDSHTRYIPPRPLEYTVATLGFFIDYYYIPSLSNPNLPPSRRYIFSKTIDIPNSKQPPHSSFKRGVTILAVDGVPVAQVVKKLASISGRANEWARLRGGTKMITFRRLAFHPPPSKPVSRIRYVSLAGSVLEIDLEWAYFSGNALSPYALNPIVVEGGNGVGGWSSSEGSGNKFMKDEEKSPLGFLRDNDDIEHIILIFKHHQTDAQQPPLFDDNGPLLSTRDSTTTTSTTTESSRQRDEDGNDEDEKERQGVRLLTPVKQFVLEDYYMTAILNTKYGKFGYVKVKNFLAPIDTDIFGWTRQIISELPQKGLVIDIRNNPGGYLLNAALLFDIISPITMSSHPRVLRASTLALRMVREYPYNYLSSLLPSVRDAVKFGQPFSGPSGSLLSFVGHQPYRRLTSNGYKGPVIVIANSATASSADLFSSFVKDYRAARLINVDGTTAGAGATVLQYQEGLMRFYPKSFPNSFPYGVSFSTAYIPMYRSAKRSGSLIEFQGVEPDQRYYYTKDDILNDSVDLLNLVASQLANSSSSSAPIFKN